MTRPSVIGVDQIECAGPVDVDVLDTPRYHHGPYPLGSTGSLRLPYRRFSGPDTAQSGSEQQALWIHVQSVYITVIGL